MWSHLKPALLCVLGFSVLTGLVYPLVVNGLAQLLFADQAGGSLLSRNGVVVGSELIGQAFTAPGYFWGRPSATGPAYNGGASAGSNLGPTNPALAARVIETISVLRAANGDSEAPVPADLATASGSGLDPHLSPAGAEYQVARVARARALPEAEVRRLVAAHTEPRQLGILGEPRVNVLRLNLALDELAVGAAAGR